MKTVNKFSLNKLVDVATPQLLCDYLAQHSHLSKAKVKDAMIKGAVWLVKGKAKRKRVRRATTQLTSGDRVEFFYDADLLARSVPSARCIDDRGRYSVWFKPAGMLAQGTDYGDHCALLRQIEQYFHPSRPALLVHRLDREAEGLMLVAHDREAAARLSALFRDNLIKKRYRVRVRGVPQQQEGEIDQPLDGKRALTHYSVVQHDADTDSSLLEVSIATGRLHQIRRHLAMIDHPVLGDPKYGVANKNREGLQLAAVGLEFRCPLGGGARDYTIQESFALVL